MAVPNKSPGEEHPPPELIEFWNQWHLCDDLGGTTRKALEELERQATECLSQRPPDLLGFRRLTVDALDFLAGRHET